MKRDHRRGVLEFKTACRSQPQRHRLAAMLAWAKFSPQGDKARSSVDTL